MPSLDQLPRERFCHLPTPLQRLPRISRHLGGPDLWIKRDDCTGLGLGGNKTRKLEYLIADALRHGATRVITAGPLQSNHCRQTAAAAAAAGLECELVIDDRLDDADHAYRTNGNILLDRLFHAILRVVPGGTDAETALEEAARELRDQGGVPYRIPVGASAPLGAAGYANASLEIHAQAQALGLRFDGIVHATGSGGTQAGLLAGHALLRSSTRIHGIDILGPAAAVQANVHALAQQTLHLLGHRDDLIQPEDVHVHGDFIGAGFGKPSARTLQAIDLLARQEAILLDPVHTGKAFDGLLGLVERGVFTKGQNILFLHTGGQASLFAYAGLWSQQEVGYRSP
ncbi:D-cysteine desulfhydrase family protein [Corticibacter populi]|uniref:D-cysteine desulfhydrase family protein n=1 Tax=Corticibacter populi TaxID=1550736 RepID=A0A3M6QXP7_9BURK|nr:D-cysteine desulfhydrase family protein [Corticibacter populi]RMX07713.1 D-cysteine desulfhydrase family protein [Corticibacter populi]RZS30228.1 D-cysteine desulfhydrase [Corticibacter populi]